MVLDVETGEVVGDKFAKLFFADIGKLFGLSGTEYSILMIMVKSIGLGNKSSLVMSPARKKEVARQLNLKRHQQVTNALHKMEAHGVVKKAHPNDRYDYEYIVSPEILFSGNDYQRVKVLIDYSSGERKVIAFKVHEGQTLNEAIQQAYERFERQGE